MLFIDYSNFDFDTNLVEISLMEELFKDVGKFGQCRPFVAEMLYKLCGPQATGHVEADVHFDPGHFVLKLDDGDLQISEKLPQIIITALLFCFVSLEILIKRHFLYKGPFEKKKNYFVFSNIFVTRAELTILDSEIFLIKANKKIIDCLSKLENQYTEW